MSRTRRVPEPNGPTRQQLPSSHPRLLEEEERNSPVQHGASAFTGWNKATWRAHKTPQRPKEPRGHGKWRRLLDPERANCNKRAGVRPPPQNQPGKNSQLMPASDPVQEKKNLHEHMKRTTFAAKKAKNSPSMILNHRRYLYIQAHSMEENSNSTERHFVVTCLLFCLPCWMDIAV